VSIFSIFCEDSAILHGRYAGVVVEAGYRLRLLKLSRRNPISEISCRLEEFPLYSTSTPSYEAISYRWDDGEKRKNIIVNDLLLSVTSRAYEVLKGRSSLIRSRWIWIDAICIDQSKSYIISY
jgi:hypothetical protein